MRGATLVDRTPIAETSAFRVLSAFDLARGVPVTLVEALRGGARAQAALAALFRAHTAPPHPAIAPAHEHVVEAGLHAVVLDVPAVTDLDGVVRLAAERGVKATHAEADGLVVTLRDALLAAARSPGRASSDRHLGSFSVSNVVFAADGRFWLVGLGHNVAVLDEDGRLAPRARFFQAPDIALGHAPSERSDFVALLMLLRGMLGFVDVHASVVRAIGGNTLRQDLELVERILWIERRVIHASAADRASIDETIAVSDRIRALIGVRPDPAGLVARVGRLLGGLETERSDARPVLRVAARGQWLERGRGPRVDLSRKRVVGRTAVVLAQARLDAPGRTLGVPELAAQCWPGERILPAAAANRVYVAVSGLRRAGVGPDLEREPGGYRIAPAVPCEVIDDGAA